MQVGDKIAFDRYQWRVLDIQRIRLLIITEKNRGSGALQ
jgi:hypothetical protein